MSTLSFPHDEQRNFAYILWSLLLTVCCSCYNICEPELSPTPPPCTKTKTESPSDTPPPVYLGNQEPEPECTTSDDCSTRTVCADYINECGMMYGG